MVRISILDHFIYTLHSIANFKPLMFVTLEIFTNSKPLLVLIMKSATSIDNALYTQYEHVTVPFGVL